MCEETYLILEGDLEISTLTFPFNYDGLLESNIFEEAMETTDEDTFDQISSHVGHKIN